MMFEIKNIGSSVKDVDLKTGTVKGYFSVYNLIDSQFDMIVPGAFTKSIKESKRILHLYQHDTTRPLSSVRSGSLKLKEDSYGLGYESTISLTSWGKDVLTLINDGVLAENSVGFERLKSYERKGYTELTELRLFEGSSVSFAANEYALNTKGLFDFDTLSQKMDSVNRVMRSGKFENEEIWDSLEIFHKQLSSLILEMSTKPVENTVQPEEEIAIQELRSINKLFKV